MLTSLVVPIEDICVIELLLEHRALWHFAILLSPHTLLALDAIIVLFKLLRTTTRQATNGKIYRFNFFLLMVLIKDALDVAGSCLSMIWIARNVRGGNEQARALAGCDCWSGGFCNDDEVLFGGDPITSIIADLL